MRLDDTGQKLARRTGRQHEPRVGVVEILQRADGVLVGQNRVRPLGLVDHHHDRRRETTGLGPGHQQGVDRVDGHLHVAILQRLEPRTVVGPVVLHRQADAGRLEVVAHLLGTQHGVAAEQVCGDGDLVGVLAGGAGGLIELLVPRFGVKKPDCPAEDGQQNQPNHRDHAPLGTAAFRHYFLLALAMA